MSRESRIGAILTLDDLTPNPNAVLVANKNRLVCGKLMVRQILTRSDPNKKSASVRQPYSYRSAAYKQGYLTLYVLLTLVTWNSSLLCAKNNTLYTLYLCFTYTYLIDLTYFALNSTRSIFLQELGLIRKPSSFMSSICDERGAELLYAGMPITEVFKVRTFQNFRSWRNYQARDKKCQTLKMVWTDFESCKRIFCKRHYDKTLYTNQKSHNPPTYP